MLPPEIGSSTQKERESYIQTTFRCKSDCDNCGMCKVFRGKTPEVVYADYIAGKRTFAEILLHELGRKRELRIVHPHQFQTNPYFHDNKQRYTHGGCMVIFVAL